METVFPGKLSLIQISFVLVSILFQICSSRRIQQFSLYSITEQIENFTQNQPDLDLVSRIVRENRLQSVCSQMGVWSFFTGKNYSTVNSYGYHPATPGWTCSKRRIMADMNSPFRSIRHLGNEDLDTPSLSLYKDPFFASEELYLNGQAISFEGSQFNFGSFGFTGQDSWTLYAESGFKGDSVCLQCKCDPLGFAIGVTYTAKLTLSASSIRRGCFGNQVLRPSGILEKRVPSTAELNFQNRNQVSLQLSATTGSKSSLTFSGAEVRLPCMMTFDTFQISSRSNWTVFSGLNYDGLSACLQYIPAAPPARTGARTRFDSGSEPQPFPEMIVSSIKFGCQLTADGSSRVSTYVAPPKVVSGPTPPSLKFNNQNLARFTPLTGTTTTSTGPPRDGRGRQLGPVYIPSEGEGFDPRKLTTEIIPIIVNYSPTTAKPSTTLTPPVTTEQPVQGSGTLSPVTETPAIPEPIQGFPDGTETPVIRQPIPGVPLVTDNLTTPGPTSGFQAVTDAPVLPTPIHRVPPVRTVTAPPRLTTPRPVNPKPVSVSTASVAKPKPTTATTTLTTNENQVESKRVTSSTAPGIGDNQAEPKPVTTSITPGTDDNQVEPKRVTTSITPGTVDNQVGPKPVTTSITPGTDDNQAEPKPVTTSITPGTDDNQVEPKPVPTSITPGTDDNQVEPKPVPTSITPSTDDNQVEPKPVPTSTTPGIDHSQEESNPVPTSVTPSTDDNQVEPKPVPTSVTASTDDNQMEPKPVPTSITPGIDHNQEESNPVPTSITPTTDDNQVEPNPVTTSTTPRIDDNKIGPNPITTTSATSKIDGNQATTPTPQKIPERPAHKDSANEVDATRHASNQEASTIEAGNASKFFTAFLIVLGILVTAMIVTIAVFIYLRAKRSSEADLE